MIDEAGEAERARDDTSDEAWEGLRDPDADGEA